MIIINTKNYVSGQKLIDLAKLIQSNDVHAILAVPASDIKPLSKLALEIYAQHIDYVETPKSTGFISANDIKKAGASGTLLNHSEHPISIDILKKIIAQCKELHLATIVCAKNLEYANKVAALKPHAIAFEDPQLIASGKSITSYRTKDVEKFVESLKGKPIVPICGAGISTMVDVRAAYALGCKGVLIASSIAGAPNPAPFLKELGKFEFS